MMNFYQESLASSSSIYASFWISGEAAPPQVNGNHDAMDVDGAHLAKHAESQVLIVPGDVLESEWCKLGTIH